MDRPRRASSTAVPKPSPISAVPTRLVKEGLCEFCGSSCDGLARVELTAADALGAKARSRSGGAGAGSALAAAGPAPEAAPTTVLSQMELLLGDLDDTRRAALTPTGRALLERVGADLQMQSADDVPEVQITREFLLLDFVVYHADCGHVVPIDRATDARMKSRVRVRGIPFKPHFWGDDLPEPRTRADVAVLPVVVSGPLDLVTYGGEFSSDDAAVRVFSREDELEMQFSYLLTSTPAPVYATVSQISQVRAKMLGFIVGWLEDGINKDKAPADLSASLDASAATQGYYCVGFDYGNQKWQRHDDVQGDDVAMAGGAGAGTGVAGGARAATAAATTGAVEEFITFDSALVTENASFLVAQLRKAFTSCETGDAEPALLHPALRDLFAIAGAKQRRKEPRENANAAQHKLDMHAVSTPLVAAIMESLFSEQMGVSKDAKSGEAVPPPPGKRGKSAVVVGGGGVAAAAAIDEGAGAAAASSGSSAQKRTKSGGRVAKVGKRTRGEDEEESEDSEDASEEESEGDGEETPVPAPRRLPRTRGGAGGSGAGSGGLRSPARAKAIAVGARSADSSAAAQAVDLGDDLARWLYGPGSGLPSLELAGFEADALDTALPEPPLTWVDTPLAAPTGGPQDTYDGVLCASGDVVTAYPAVDTLTARVYHTGVNVAPRGVAPFNFNVGDYVRVPCRIASAATAGDANPHAHLPRAEALSPTAGEVGASLADVLRCITKEAGAGLGLAHGAPGLPLPAAAFASLEALRGFRAAELDAEDAGAAWHRAPYIVREKSGALAAEATFHSLRGGDAPAFSYMSLRNDEEVEIVRVSALFFDAETQRGWFHGVRFMPEVLTTLGEVAHPAALVRVDECATLPVAAVTGVAVVRDTDPRSAYAAAHLLPMLLSTAKAVDAVGSATRDDTSTVAGGSVLADQIVPEGGEEAWEHDWRATGGLVPFTTSAPSPSDAASRLKNFSSAAVSARSAAIDAVRRAPRELPAHDARVHYHADTVERATATSTPPPSEFFAHKKHDCVMAWSDISRSEQACWSAAHTLRRVRVLVPTTALAHAADVPSASAPWSKNAAKMAAAGTPPPGYTIASALHVWCPACDAKRTAGAMAAPRPLGAALSSVPSSGAAAGAAPVFSYSAMTQRGRLTAVGTGVYVNAVAGRENFPAADLSFHWQRPRAAWEQEQLISVAQSARAERFENEGDKYTELFRLNAGNPGAARPIKAWDFTPPLQVLLVTAIRAAAYAGGEGPLVKLAGAPLYRPEDAPMPEASARSYHFQELLMSRACEAEEGMDADLAFGVCRVFRADGIARDTDAALLKLTTSHFDNVFFVRSAVNHCAAPASLLSAPAHVSSPTTRTTAAVSSSRGDEDDDDDDDEGGGGGASRQRRRSKPDPKIGAAPSAAAFECACPRESGAHLPTLAAASKHAGFDAAAIALLPPLPLEQSEILAAGSSPLAIAPAFHPQDVHRTPGEPLHGPSPLHTPPMLNMMGHFAGAGGLDEGIRQSGAARTTTAVEFEAPAAKTFAANHPSARVLCNDCNLLLDIRLHPWKAGALAHGNFAARGLPAVSADALLLPPKGETQLLVGGPPCQGFSGMNRFNVSTHSKAKNSHIVPYLSYLDFYRPRFFMLENVPNVMQHPSASPHHVVRMILRSVLEMGYQARVAVLQAGHHGIAQSRVRLIVIAAMPGLVLPAYPAPVHTFESRRYSFPLNVAIGRWPVTANGEINKRDKSRPGVDVVARPDWTTPSAPLRLVRLRDVLSDLPALSNEGTATEAGASASQYRNGTPTPFQIRMRAQGGLLDAARATLTHHAPKRLIGLERARAALIPMWPGADWRDLPNQTVDLGAAGGRLGPIPYYGIDARAESFGMSLPRAVCACNTVDPRDKTAAERKAAERKVMRELADRVKGADRVAPGADVEHSHYEVRAIIPWSLPHTGFRHNQWKGLYGRHCADGTTGTVVTSTQLISKQGCWLHPSEDRMLSVREAARLQGFPDEYKFCGTVLDHYKQVGNAVPTPLGRALGWIFGAAFARSLANGWGGGTGTGGAGTGAGAGAGAAGKRK